jgi:hypothetical protein
VLIKLTSALFLLANFAANVSAAELGCAEQGGATCNVTPAITVSPTLREQIDSTKKKIAETLFGLEVMAFGDANSYYKETGDPAYQWGSFEVDAAIDTPHDIQGAIAIVKDAADTKMTVGFLDYNTSGARIAPRGRLSVEKGFHIQVGRFDIPFGNDWQFFASKDICQTALERLKEGREQGNTAVAEAELQQIETILNAWQKQG